MSAGTQTLDRKDLQILAHLFRDSRASLRAIGREVDLGVSAVKGRIRNLVASGGIEQFGIGVNPTVFGYTKRCVFSFHEDEMDEATMSRLKRLGKPVARAEMLGGLSWIIMVAKKKDETKLAEFKGAPKLLWTEDVSKDCEFDVRLSNTDLLIIKYLMSTPRAAIGDIADYASVSAKTVSQRLDRLRREKAVRFGIQINPRILGVALASIMIRMKDGTSTKILDRIDETLRSRFLYVRYPRVDQAAVRCYLCARNVYEIEPARKVITSIDGVEATEEYIYCRTNRLRDWAVEEVDARLAKYARAEEAEKAVDDRVALQLPVHAS